MRYSCLKRYKDLHHHYLYVISAGVDARTLREGALMTHLRGAIRVGSTIEGIDEILTLIKNLAPRTSVDNARSCLQRLASFEGSQG